MDSLENVQKRLEIICDEARTDPSNGYLEPEAHPASITP